MEECLTLPYKPMEMSLILNVFLMFSEEYLFDNQKKKKKEAKMAAFIAKQMMGNQLSAVKGKFLLCVNLMQFLTSLLHSCPDIGGGESMSAEEKERLAQLEQERLEALK